MDDKHCTFVQLTDFISWLIDRITELHEKTNVGINAFYTYVELMNMRWDGTSPLDTHIAAI
jgi:hypothetical protein